MPRLIVGGGSSCCHCGHSISVPTDDNAAFLNFSSAFFSRRLNTRLLNSILHQHALQPPTASCSLTIQSYRYNRLWTAELKTVSLASAAGVAHV